MESMRQLVQPHVYLCLKMMQAQGKKRTNIRTKVFFEVFIELTVFSMLFFHRVCDKPLSVPYQNLPE